MRASIDTIYTASYSHSYRTSGENIGDSGLIQAYRAWKANYDDSLEDGNEFILPGLNYTREQMFFISFARSWAQNIKPAAAVSRSYTCVQHEILIVVHHRSRVYGRIHTLQTDTVSTARCRISQSLQPRSSVRRRRRYV